MGELSKLTTGVLLVLCRQLAVAPQQNAHFPQQRFTGTAAWRKSFGRFLCNILSFLKLLSSLPPHQRQCLNTETILTQQNLISSCSLRSWTMCQSMPGSEKDSQIPTYILLPRTAEQTKVSEVISGQPKHRTLWENLGPMPNAGVRAPPEGSLESYRH